MATRGELANLTDVTRRFAAFVAERYPFALSDVLTAVDTVSAAGIDTWLPLSTASVSGFTLRPHEVLEDALRVEKADEVYTVLWRGDGAPHNWRLAEQLLPNAIQILDWYHAVKHAVDCGKVLLGEESPWLPLWQQRRPTDSRRRLHIRPLRKSPPASRWPGKARLPIAAQ